MSYQISNSKKQIVREFIERYRGQAVSVPTIMNDLRKRRANVALWALYGSISESTVRRVFREMLKEGKLLPWRFNRRGNKRHKFTVVN